MWNIESPWNFSTSRCPSGTLDLGGRCGRDISDRILGPLRGVCTPVNLCVHTYVCMCVWKTVTSDVILQMKSTLLLLFWDSLSLTLNSLSRPGWLASNPQGLVSLSPSLRSQAHSTMLDFSSWVLGLELRSLCLPGKLLTKPPFCPEILAFHGSTYLGLSKFGKQNRVGINKNQDCLPHERQVMPRCTSGVPGTVQTLCKYLCTNSTYEAKEEVEKTCTESSVQKCERQGFALNQLATELLTMMLNSLSLHQSDHPPGRGHRGRLWACLANTSAQDLRCFSLHLRTFWYFYLFSHLIFSACMCMWCIFTGRPGRGQHWGHSIILFQLKRYF